MSLEVTGGTFYRSYTSGGCPSGGTGGGFPATVSSFLLDKYLVTVGRFRQFVAAWNDGSGYRPAAGSGKHTYLNGGNGLNASGGGYETGWDADWNTDVDPTGDNLTLGCYDPSDATWTDAAGSQENLPIVCVNWYEAYAFCIWDGGFLPSQTEWEYAAAGGAQQRYYPWGMATPGTACPGTGCEYAIYNCLYPSGSDGGLGSCVGVENFAPVGTATLGAGLWGQLDLAGDAWEWNLDWVAPFVTPCTDCANLSPTSYRIDRGGGAIASPAGQLVVSYTLSDSPSDRDDIGFRCARAP